MFFINLIRGLLPISYSHFDQASAIVVITTSLAIGGAMVLLVLYWLLTKSFETIKTIFAMLAIMLVLAICIGLATNHQVKLGAWILILLMLLINLANMAGYGIATSASSAYFIPILLTIFCIGIGAGYIITFVGCVFVFGIAFLQSKEKLKTFLPYQVSHLTFDAPVLSLLYVLTAVIAGSWLVPLNEVLLAK